MSRVEKFQLRVNFSKCVFDEHEVVFLGHIVNADGIQKTGRVKAIVNYSKPNTIDDLPRFLGMVNFYRPYLPHAVETQLPLNAFHHNARKKDEHPVRQSPSCI